MKNMNKPLQLLVCVLLLSVFMSSCSDKPVPYRQENHGSFEDEFPPHAKGNGWWYVTGYLRDNDKEDQLYSFQFTQMNLRDVFPFLPPVYALQLAVTNMQTGEHLFEKHFSLANMPAYANEEAVAFGSRSLLTRNENGMEFSGKMKNAEMALHFDLGKGASWHGDNGVLIMGLPDDPVQRTMYYSYTNMPTTGEITFIKDNGERTELTVTGKSWFDRQWGPYRLTDPESSFWEWFSLRFFDEEEIMLFSFPQHPYQDGTYIDAAGNTERIENYTYTPTDYVKVEDSCFSFGWDLTMPGIKEEHYRIEPLIDGQYHLAYFELMAKVLNDKDELVGYAFAELLPGVRAGMCQE